MKCFVHQSTDAIGVCSTCGRGLCNACVVKIGGKFYCKDDADRAFGRKLTTRVVAGEKERGAALMVGSILAYLVGGVAVVLSCFVLFAGILAGDLGATTSSATSSRHTSRSWDRCSTTHRAR